MEIIVIDITMHVPELDKTFKWYADIFGWKYGCDIMNDKGECLYGDVYVSHDPLVGFNLSKSERQFDPSCFHPLIKVPDVDYLYDEIKDNAVEILHEPQDQGWGRIMRVLDINGFILEFWSEQIS